jgi:hypothetical protein
VGTQDGLRPCRLERLDLAILAAVPLGEQYQAVPLTGRRFAHRGQGAPRVALGVDVRPAQHAHTRRHRRDEARIARAGDEGGHERLRHHRKAQDVDQRLVIHHDQYRRLGVDDADPLEPGAAETQQVQHAPRHDLHVARQVRALPSGAQERGRS